MDVKNTKPSVVTWPRQGLSEHVRAAPVPSGPRPTREQAEEAVRTLIAFTGDDPQREGLLETPKRVVDAYEEMFHGYRECPLDVLDKTFGEIGGYDDFVLVKDIELQLALRAPHDAVLRQGAHRLQAGRAGGRAVQAGAAGRRLCAAPADAGTHDLADRHRAR